jgi:hypothetical protein
MPQRATTTSFKKGQSGNPKGKPPMTPEKREFKEAFILLLPKAWERVSEMLEPTADFEERRFAVQTVMDRAYGKAVERKELSGPDGGKIPIEDSTPSIRLLLQQALASAEPKVIEGEDVTEPDRFPKDLGGQPRLE